MIHWLLQTTAAHAGLSLGHAPPGLLSPEETAVFQSFKVPKRRQDWLLGRWTAKHLLRELLGQEWGQRIELNAIIILPGQDGAPNVHIDSAFSNLDIALTISISHSHRSSLCAAVVRPDWPLGADVERIEPRSANFAADFFTVKERSQIRRAPLEMREGLISAVWSGKEAALKAIREGLRIDTRSLSCQFEALKELPSGWSPFTISWEQKLDSSRLPDLKGWWMVKDGFVLTLAVEEDRIVSYFEEVSDSYRE